MTVNVIPFFSPISPSQLRTELEDELREAGSRVLSPEEFLSLRNDNADAVQRQHNMLLVGTGGTENLITEFLARGRLNPPIILLSHTQSNSLPAAMEVRAYLQKRGVAARIVHAPSSELVKTIHEWCGFSSIEEKIQNSRLAVIGRPSPWLVASTVSASEIRKRWGTTIFEVPLDDLTGLLDKPASKKVKAAIDEFVQGAVCIEVSEEEVRKAGMVSQAMEELAQKHNVDALSVECFTLERKTGISGCCALSWLNNLQGIVAGCEGDIPAAFTMMVAKFLTGQPAFLANIAEIDEAANSVVAAHCTIPTSIVNTYEITTHFETGKSVALRGELPLQPVTIMKMWGDNLSQYWVSKGDVVENLRNETGCRTQVRVHLAKPVRHLLDGSLANHHVIVPGDYADTVERFLVFNARK
jgi:L-fucose isomerase-like protein